MKTTKEKKFIIIGTSNDGLRYLFTFKKKEYFKVAFSKLMEDLEFNQEIIRDIFLVHDDMKDTIKLKISDLKDKLMHFQNSKHDLEVFFGEKKIIVIVRTNDKKSLSKFILKNSNFANPIKIKKALNKK